MPLRFRRSPATPAVTTILVVDDEPTVCAFFDRALRQAGWRVLMAQDGLAALAVLKRAPVDVIRCDAVMPQTDRLALCLRVRHDPALVAQVWRPRSASILLSKPLMVRWRRQQRMVAHGSLGARG